MNYARLARGSRFLNQQLGTRSFSYSSVLKNDIGTIQPQKRTIGGFRGGILGFLLGFSIASSFAAYHLLEEYHHASSTLQASVEELKNSTDKVSAHVRRIEAVEKDLKALAGASASKEDASRVRAEVKKLYDGLRLEFLDLQTHVWGIQQDLHKLSKQDSTEVRI